MSNDDFDDGLVHSHGWATEPPAMPAGPMLKGAEIAAAMAQHPEEQDCYDDGLVHSHGWACGERSRLAHQR
ncbi:hypothetical protein [Paracraurococcus ruber]|uniref:Uncharacterized protein n=1 Tax=Paracraurococcus ruber TaxID=77675 RepID=A0ABS1CZF4_9PROT|nr:hypothetical protein [Paracraurococcus ruber]MBK1659892.1 hypothetical protein [Paracraurococcus ruber]TDG31433.1 hypothetical protein E2C05_10975 [Paracraurococcus ruber]